MNEKYLIEYKKKINSLGNVEKKKRDLYLKKISSGELFGPKTGVPSIDKVFLKYYDETLIMDDIPKNTLYGYVYEQNKQHLNEVVFIYYDVKITYKQFFEEIEKVAKGLIALGVKAHDIVTIGMASTPEAYYTLYAINKIGAIADIVDMFGNTKENLKKCLNETYSKYLFINDVGLSDVLEIKNETNVKKIVCAKIGQSVPFDIPNLPNMQISSDEDIKTWEYFIKTEMNITYKINTYCPMNVDVYEHTGGSSGFPKGCKLTNDGLNGQVWQLADSPLDFKRGEIWLGLMPIFASFGLMGGHLAIANGLVSILVPFYDPKSFINLIKKYNPNRFACSPAFYEVLLQTLETENIDVSNIRYPMVGGDSLNFKLEKAVNAVLETPIIHGYSLTECSAGSTCNMGVDIRKESSVGIPLVKLNCKVVDTATGKELGYGEVGELCFCGTNIMIGYNNREKETKEALELSDDGIVWLHTGDLGKMDEDGFVYYKGRLKRLIVRNDGCKVYPSFIEAEILRHSKVQYCAVVGVRDFRFIQGELPYAYIVLKEHEMASKREIEDEIREICMSNLPVYSIPEEFIFVEMLKKTKVGKVDFIALKEEKEKQIMKRRERECRENTLVNAAAGQER